MASSSILRLVAAAASDAGEVPSPGLFMVYPIAMNKHFVLILIGLIMVMPLNGQCPPASNRIWVRTLFDRPTKSHEILMFVGLQKDAKECCDVTRFDRARCYVL